MTLSTLASESSNAMDVALMLATAEGGLLLQEYQDIDANGAVGFLGVAVPHLLVNKKALVTSGGTPYTSHVHRVSMQGFSGLQVTSSQLYRAPPWLT